MAGVWSFPRGIPEARFDHAHGHRSRSGCLSSETRGLVVAVAFPPPSACVIPSAAFVVSSQFCAREAWGDARGGRGGCSLGRRERADGCVISPPSQVRLIPTRHKQRAERTMHESANP